MSLYTSEDYTEDEKRNLAFQTTVAIREAVSVAKRIPTQVAYESVFDLINDIDPELYGHITDLLTKKNKSEEVELAIAEANAISTDEAPVTPTDILERKLEPILAALKKEPKSRPLKREKSKLLAAKEYFQQRTPSEHKILNQDFFLATRSYAVNAPIYKDEKRIDYKLGNDRILRLRMFHPDNEEHIIGSDLVYEQYDLKNERVRLVHLQYKVWDEKDVLYFSKGNMSSQLDKLSDNICNNNMCVNRGGVNYTKGYRLPFCAAFLRPTDRKQGSDSSLVTSGLHCPVCKIQQVRKSEEKKITKDTIRNMSVGHSIFEEMFVYNMLGSRWFSFDELEDYYDKVGVETEMNTIRIHAQEIYIEPENIEQLKKEV